MNENSFIDVVADIGDDIGQIFGKLGFTESETKQIINSMQSEGLFDGLHIRGVWTENGEIKVAQDTGVMNDAGQYVVRLNQDSLDVIAKTIAASQDSDSPIDLDGKVPEIQSLASSITQSSNPTPEEVAQTIEPTYETSDPDFFEDHVEATEAMPIAEHSDFEQESPTTQEDSNQAYESEQDHSHDRAQDHTSRPTAVSDSMGIDDFDTPEQRRQKHGNKKRVSILVNQEDSEATFAQNDNRGQSEQKSRKIPVTDADYQEIEQAFIAPQVGPELPTHDKRSSHALHTRNAITVNSNEDTGTSIFVNTTAPAAASFSSDQTLEQDQLTAADTQDDRNTRAMLRAMADGTESAPVMDLAGNYTGEFITQDGVTFVPNQNASPLTEDQAQEIDQQHIPDGAFGMPLIHADGSPSGFYIGRDGSIYLPEEHGALQDEYNKVRAMQEAQEQGVASVPVKDEFGQLTGELITPDGTVYVPEQMPYGDTGSYSANPMPFDSQPGYGEQAWDNQMQPRTMQPVAMGDYPTAAESFEPNADPYFGKTAWHDTYNGYGNDSFIKNDTNIPGVM
jgi:hypothetical protein